MKNSLLVFFLIIGHSSFGKIQKTVKSEYFNIIIELPDGWDLVEKEKNITTTGLLPENLGIIFIENTDETVDQRFEFYLRELEMGKNFKSCSEGYEVINGQKYRWVEYEMKSMGLKSIAIFI